MAAAERKKCVFMSQTVNVQQYKHLIRDAPSGTLTLVLALSLNIITAVHSQGQGQRRGGRVGEDRGDKCGMTLHEEERH